MEGDRTHGDHIGGGRLAFPHPTDGQCRALINPEEPALGSPGTRRSESTVVAGPDCWPTGSLGEGQALGFSLDFKKTVNIGLTLLTLPSAFNMEDPCHGEIYLNHFKILLTLSNFLKVRKFPKYGKQLKVKYPHTTHYIRKVKIDQSLKCKT